MGKRKRTSKSNRTKKNNNGKRTSNERGKNLLLAIIVILLLMFGLGAMTRIFGGPREDPPTESSGTGREIRVTEIILDEERLIF